MNPYFRRENFTLYLGDCLEVLDKFPAEYFDMIFSDPPYLLSNGGFTVHAGRRVSVDKGAWDRSKGVEEDFNFHLKWLEACRRVLRQSGTIWISGTYHSIYHCGFALQKLGYHILNDIAWFKPNASPNLSGRYFTASHETLIWAKKDKNAKHYFDYRLTKSGEWADILKKPGKQMRSVWGILEDKPEGTIWFINTPPTEEKIFGKHPTQKPLALLERLILLSTKEGDVILDPFSGSSTAGLAAVQLGRKFVGVDTEKAYLDLSVKRFEVLVRQPQILKT